MIEVAVADDDVFDLLRIQAGLFHSGYQNLFGLFRRVQRINDNNPLAGGDGPRTDVVETDVIEVVENLRRLESLPWNRRLSCFLTQHCRPLRASRRTQVPCFGQKIGLRDRHRFRDVRLRLLGFLPLLLRQAGWLLPALLGNEVHLKRRATTCGDKKCRQ